MCHKLVFFARLSCYRKRHGQIRSWYIDFSFKRQLIGLLNPIYISVSLLSYIFNLIKIINTKLPTTIYCPIILHRSTSSVLASEPGLMRARRSFGRARGHVQCSRFSCLIFLCSTKTHLGKQSLPAYNICFLGDLLNSGFSDWIFCNFRIKFSPQTCQIYSSW